MPVIQISDRHDVENRYVYRIDTDTQPLGSGGMGKVFRGERIDNAKQTVTPVAIKFLFDNQPDGVIDRARREASIRLRSENLVEMIDFVEVEQQGPMGPVLRYHVVSELLHGVMLLDLLQGKTTDIYGNEVAYARELYNLYKSNTDAFAVKIIKDILNGLLAMHNAGYIHRDLDPSNIMITSDRKVKIIDFGIAKRVDAMAYNDQQLTSVGQFMGKAAYAAPELISGDLQNQNKTTDLYAVGIMLYVLIVGELPFTGKLADIMNKQLTQPIPVKNISNPRLRKIVAKATQKEQAKRYQSAARFIVDLESNNSGGNGKSQSSSNSSSASVGRILIGVGATIVGLAVGYFVASLFL